MKIREKFFDTEFDFFLNKFVTGENFNLLRFSDGELFMLQGKKISLGNFLVKINGKFSGIKKFPTYDHKTFNPKKDKIFLEKLSESFNYKSQEYYVGINCRCCVGEENYKWQFREHLKTDHNNLTWANVLINSNYPRFLNEFYPEIVKRGAILVCNVNAKLDNLNWVTKDFRIGNNAFSNLTLIDKIKEYIISNNIKNQIFLFSASAFSNVAQYELGKLFPENTYIDIGTSLSHVIGIPAEREYILDYFSGNIKNLKKCTWN